MSRQIIKRDPVDLPRNAMPTPEPLVRFDIAEAIRDPMRIRRARHCMRPLWVLVNEHCVCVAWDYGGDPSTPAFPDTYIPKGDDKGAFSFGSLALAAPTVRSWPSGAMG